MEVFLEGSGVGLIPFRFLFLLFLREKEKELR